MAAENVAELPIPGTKEDFWVRQEAPDGRLYFFNKATGVSQWHVPTELYDSRCLSRDNTNLREDFITKMPGSARAMLGVDVMTEIPGAGINSQIVKVREHLMSSLTETEEEPPRVKEHLFPQNLLRLNLIRARGLRDADFMPGRDKSDPYCLVEILGKEEESRFRTAVVMDDLDPVWNHVQLMPSYVPGDIISLSVWDEDNNEEVVKAAQEMEVENVANLYASLAADELLGKLLLTHEDLMEGSKEEVDYLLDDAGPGIEATITLRANMIRGWPMLKGRIVSDAKDDLEYSEPDLSIFAYEQADPGSVVTAWESIHMKEGYSGTFFGAYKEAAAKLKKGDRINLDGRVRSVKKVSRKGGVDAHDHREQVYVYVDEDINGILKVGAKWKKITATPPPGEDLSRVILYYDIQTKLVTNVPVMG